MNDPNRAAENRRNLRLKTRVETIINVALAGIDTLVAHVEKNENLPFFIVQQAKKNSTMFPSQETQWQEIIEKPLSERLKQFLWVGVRHSTG